jgi:hypothetical protein
MSFVLQECGISGLYYNTEMLWLSLFLCNNNVLSVMKSPYTNLAEVCRGSMITLAINTPLSFKVTWCGSSKFELAVNYSVTCCIVLHGKAGVRKSWNLDVCNTLRGGVTASWCNHEQQIRPCDNTTVTYLLQCLVIWWNYKSSYVLAMMRTKQSQPIWGSHGGMTEINDSYD